MSHLRWSSRPHLDQPILVAGFEGWNDAGDAASGAIDHLVDHWGAVPFADVDPEDFYDFTATRPHVRIDEGNLRRIDWPANRFTWAAPPGSPPVILLRGIEPQLRWRTFGEQVLEVASTLRVRLVLTLGALLADVPHTRPTSVYGTADDPKVIDALGLEPSRYEGPTGIVGVLHAACRDGGVNSASLWAAVPSYVGAAPSPKATLALVERVAAILGTPPPVGPLPDAAAAYEDQIDQLVAEDPETVSYVEHLEATHDREALAGSGGADIVAEIERFLREQ